MRKQENDEKRNRRNKKEPMGSSRLKKRTFEMKYSLHGINNWLIINGERKGQYALKTQQ